MVILHCFNVIPTLTKRILRLFIPDISRVGKSGEIEIKQLAVAQPRLQGD